MLPKSTVPCPALSYVTSQSVSSLSASLILHCLGFLYPPWLVPTPSISCAQSLFHKCWHKKGFGSTCLFPLLRSMIHGLSQHPAFSPYLQPWLLPSPLPPVSDISAWFCHSPKTKPWITNTTHPSMPAQTFYCSQIPQPSLLSSPTIHPVTKAKDLGFTLDAELFLAHHIQTICRSYLQNISQTLLSIFTETVPIHYTINPGMDHYKNLTSLPVSTLASPLTIFIFFTASRVILWKHINQIILDQNNSD